LLGQGGFAQVWEAESKDKRRVALKFIPCRRDLSAAREIRAIQAIRQLTHANLLDIEQVCSEMDCIVVAMELADGSLLDLLGKYREVAGGPIEADVLCYYLAQAAQAIDFLNNHQH
jgi:serine/threonine protein kinase